MKFSKTLLAGALASMGVAGIALAAGLYTNGIPQAGGSQYPSTIPLTGNELIPADTQLGGGLNPATEAISTLQLAGYVGQLPAKSNVLIGGDATTNLWQRATTGSSVTTTVTYGGPDRWAYWSGTSTAMTVSRDSTASDVASGYHYAFKMARTSGQTGVVQMCMAQEIESANVYQLRGQTAELDFHAYTGANFSAANANMTAYVVTGTGTDEGMVNLAFGLNAGGGGAAAWTGQANATAAVISLGAVSTAGRYAAVASIPSTATEAAVVLCYTPVGTAGTNDYVAFSGIQLVRNSSLASYASATVGYPCTSISCTAFDRTRGISLEALMQYRYYYQINEATGPSVIAVGRSHSTTVAEAFLPFPVPMRVVPTMTYTAGFATETTAAGGTLGACSALATSSTVASTAAALTGVSVACTATTVPAAGVTIQLFNNGGSGVIKANAEL
jgi:hypothetical protein